MNSKLHHAPLLVDHSPSCHGASMTETVHIRLGGQSPLRATSHIRWRSPDRRPDMPPGTTSWASDQRRLDVPPALIATGTMLTLCMLSLLSIFARGFEASDDGAGFVPIIALLGIGLAVFRWHPDHREAPVRAISRNLATTITIAAIAIIAMLVVDSSRPGLLTGMSITVALSAGYLVVWGYRSVALLRAVLLLSMLTWSPVADVAHEVVRSSIEQPSDLIYQRLAHFHLFGIDEEPWRLFTASLHRGSLVVIATIVFAVGASRWRLSARVFADLAMVAATALVAHHAVVLASPLDVYDRPQRSELAADPAVEIVIAAVAVLMLSAIRWRREWLTGNERKIDHNAPDHGSLTERDPIIFSSNGAALSRPTTALVLTGFLPLIVLAVAS